VLTFLAEPMIIGTWIGCVAWAAAAYFGPETKGKVLVPGLVGTGSGEPAPSRHSGFGSPTRGW
jgi:hypothetical protein